MSKEMSGIAKEELANRTKGMSKEELQLVIKLIPTNMLWDEMKRRDEIKTARLQAISKTMGMEVPEL